MIDLHSHVLPGIDDGPATVEDSLALARAAVEAGTAELVATPHVTWDLPTASATVRAGVETLQAELDAAGIALRLRTGGELSVSKAADLDDEELHALHLGGGEWLLSECPLRTSATGFEHAVRHLHMRGHRILLAHPERSPILQRDPAKLEALVAEGMLVQITAGSLAGAFGSTVQRFTLGLLEHGLVHVVASDAHDAVHRPPGLMDAIRATDAAELPGLVEHAQWMTVEVPRALLDGGPIPDAPGPPPRRRRRGLLRAVGRRR